MERRKSLKGRPLFGQRCKWLFPPHFNFLSPVWCLCLLSVFPCVLQHQYSKYKFSRVSYLQCRVCCAFIRSKKFIFVAIVLFWFTVVNSDSNIAMIADSFLTPSPEEQIIRQRSRIALFESEGNYSCCLVSLLQHAELLWLNKSK